MTQKGKGDNSRFRTIMILIGLTSLIIIGYDAFLYYKAFQLNDHYFKAHDVYEAIEQEFAFTQVETFDAFANFNRGFSIERKIVPGYSFLVEPHEEIQSIGGLAKIVAGTVTMGIQDTIIEIKERNPSVWGIVSGDVEKMTDYYQSPSIQPVNIEFYLPRINSPDNLSATVVIEYKIDILTPQFEDGNSYRFTNVKKRIEITQEVELVSKEQQKKIDSFALSWDEANEIGNYAMKWSFVAFIALFGLGSSFLLLIDSYYPKLFNVD